MTDKALSVIDNINVGQVSNIMQSIASFQAVVQKTLKQNHDYGVIPGTPKPTLLKPGAEKILMLMGLTSEYDIVEKVEDYDQGVFAYTVKSTLLRNGAKITEGFGSCNSKEDKYRWRWVYENELPAGTDKDSLKQNQYGKYRIPNEEIFSQVNTILKMAKKRAQVDATLTVAALSEIFTQDIEDMDIQGNPTEATYTPKTDNPSEIVINFGKHKGKKLGEIPADYLKWLAEKGKDQWMRDAAAKVLGDPAKPAADTEPDYTPPDDIPFGDDIPYGDADVPPQDLFGQ